ncbi:type II secretion system protein GspH [Chromatiales bacterium (ex Bugula neritina AB1)]|nr:type II secretion system protein GspH [Chromatiales bacterium (ex Bugula neritina AB1)]
MIFSYPDNNRGVTLVELLMVVVIVGIMAGVAAPGFGSFMAERSVTAETRRLIGALKLARSEARARGGVVTLARTSAGWDGEIRIYEDVSGANSPFTPTDDDLIRIEESAGRSVDVVDNQGSVSSDVWISFNSQGWLAETRPIVLAICAAALDESRGMYIEVNQVGKIRERRIADSNKGCKP